MNHSVQFTLSMFVAALCGNLVCAQPGGFNRSADQPALRTDRNSLHPTLKGYQVWADGLKPIFTEILGPPAKTDHAPPPTGDPSAKPSRNN